MLRIFKLICIWNQTRSLYGSGTNPGSPFFSKLCIPELGLSATCGNLSYAIDQFIYSKHNLITSVGIIAIEI